MANNVNVDAWLKRLNAVVNGTTDTGPDGFKTCQELIEALGISATTLYRKLKVLEANREAECRLFKIRDRSNRLMTVPHWKLLK